FLSRDKNFKVGICWDPQHYCAASTGKFLKKIMLFLLVTCFFIFL
ncbi:unnamed protein product, partial [marine sediment metagenome]